MKINILVIVALTSTSSFMQGMEKKPGSFEDIANAMQKITEMKDKIGGSAHSIYMAELQEALKNLALATGTQKTSQDQSTLQKLQAEVASIKQTQNEIAKKLDHLEQNSNQFMNQMLKHNATLMQGFIMPLIKNPEHAATIGNAIQMWISMYYPQIQNKTKTSDVSGMFQTVQRKLAENVTSEEETFANRRRVEKPLRSDLEPVDHSDVRLHYDDAETF